MKNQDELLGIISSSIEHLRWEREPHGLYEPIQYTLNLGGKRIRPVLVLMACNMFTENLNPALKPALGIEIFHNFTLLHDDIMDKARIRRGNPTVHIKWNENTAILSGDVMQIIAYMMLSEAPQDRLKRVLDIFSKTAIQICEGQQFDMEYELRKDVEPQEYMEMIRLKTAVLLGCALKIGAVIGGADEADANGLYDFGINIGLAFQLKDDLLDVYGDEKSFGKKLGGDILCNKNTYLLIHAKKQAEGNVKTQLDYLLSPTAHDPEYKVHEMINIYNQLGVRKICEDAMQTFYDKAIASLDMVRVDSSKKQELRKLADKLMVRNE